MKARAAYSNPQSDEEEVRAIISGGPHQPRASDLDSQGQPLEEWKKNKHFSRKYYALIALASGLCIGTQVFLLQVVVYGQIANLNFVLFLPVFMGYLTTSLIYHGRQAIANYQKSGAIWSLKGSAYFISDEVSPLLGNGDRRIQINLDGGVSRNRIRINYFNLFGMLAKAFVTLSSQAMKISVMYTAARAGFNYSLAINLYSMTPFLTAIAFYFVFKETLNSLHLVGMALLFVCIVITSQAS
jgi:hypothetical protein